MLRGEAERLCQDENKVAHCINTFLYPLAQDVADLSIPVRNGHMVRARRLCMEGGAERHLVGKDTSGFY